MSKLANLYANELKRHFKILYANWEPGGPLHLGDYGILDGNIFIPKGNLKNDFIEFKGNVIKITADPTADHKEFKSERAVEINLVAKGTVTAGIPLAKAALEVKFGRKDSIFFNAAGCTTNRISNKLKVGEILKELLKEKKWEKEYCVVTDLVKAGRTVIAISQGRNSTISFEAESPAVERINLADASVKLNLTSERSIGYKVDGAEGLDILLGLCKIKNAFIWGSGEFGHKAMRMTESMEFRIENSSAFKTEESLDELYFGQMGKE